MSRARPRSHQLLAAGTAVVLVVAACGGPSPSTSGSASPAIAPSTGPFVPMTYPEDGPAPCDQDTSETLEHGPYRGTIRRISATDAMTVMFELCDSDPAFLAKIASPSLAINDTAWLGSRIDPASVEQRILSEVNGTGPFGSTPVVTPRA